MMTKTNTQAMLASMMALADYSPVYGRDDTGSFSTSTKKQRKEKKRLRQNKRRR